MEKKIIAEVRGAYSGKDPDDTASFAFVFKDDSGIIKESYGVLEKGRGLDHIYAEYMAVVKALKWLLKSEQIVKNVIVKTNLELLFKQMKGEWNLKSKRIITLKEKIDELVKKLLEKRSIVVNFELFSKDKNKRAIELSKLALDDLSLLGKIRDKEGKICPKCGNRLIKREGRYGPFYGCSNYPDCRYTEDIKDK
ncbi:MAG: topoisomerase DNA-binding C4 zinc finger domain-containing protein [Thermoplasmatota archaeon]